MGLFTSLYDLQNSVPSAWPMFSGGPVYKSARRHLSKMEFLVDYVLTVSAFRDVTSNRS